MRAYQSGKAAKRWIAGYRPGQAVMVRTSVLSGEWPAEWVRAVVTGTSGLGVAVKVVTGNAYTEEETFELHTLDRVRDIRFASKRAEPKGGG